MHYHALLQIDAIFDVHADVNTGDIVPVGRTPKLQILNERVDGFYCRIGFLWMSWERDLSDQIRPAIHDAIMSPATTLAMQQAFNAEGFSEGPLIYDDKGAC